MAGVAFGAVLVATATLLALKGPSAGDESATAVNVDVSRSTYGVDGRNRADILAAFWRKGPDGHWAATWWRYSFEKRIREDGNGCRVELAAVKLELWIKMPRVAWFASMPECLRRNFEGMLPALERHEQEHAAIARRGARSMAGELAALPPAATCAEAEAQFEAGSQAAVGKVNAAQAAFDRSSENGAREGVSFEDCVAR